MDSDSNNQKKSQKRV